MDKSVRFDTHVYTPSIESNLNSFFNPNVEHNSVNSYCPSQIHVADTTSSNITTSIKSNINPIDHIVCESPSGAQNNTNIETIQLNNTSKNKNKKAFSNLKIDSDKKILMSTFGPNFGSLIISKNTTEYIWFDTSIDSTSNNLIDQPLISNFNHPTTVQNLKPILKLDKTPKQYINKSVKFNLGNYYSIFEPTTFTNNKNQTCNLSINKHTPPSFATTVYRKPTYTGLMTKWNSFVPHSYKVSTISSMVYRAIRICSTYQALHEEIEFIEFISLLNKYPLNFIKAQIRKTLNRHILKQTNTQISVTNEIPIENNRHLHLDLPFLDKPTRLLEKQIKKLTKDIDPKVNLRVIQRPLTSISNCFPSKETIPNYLKSNVVYKVDCDGCDASYIGKTTRQIKRRFKEHGYNPTETINNVLNINIEDPNLRRSKRNNKPVQYYPSETEITSTIENNVNTNSAIKQHEVNVNHKINWTNYNILAKINKHYQLLVVESLLINNLKPKLNKTVTSVPLIIFPEGLQNVRPRVKMKPS